jgi:hypothetical protein
MPKVKEAAARTSGFAPVLLIKVVGAATARMPSGFRRPIARELLSHNI